MADGFMIQRQPYVILTDEETIETLTAKLGEDTLWTDITDNEDGTFTLSDGGPDPDVTVTAGDYLVEGNPVRAVDIPTDQYLIIPNA